MDRMPLLAGVSALFGLLIGSFLNVVIGRVPEGRSVVRPPSACPRCGNEIRTRDNIPIVSWLLLGRKCRALLPADFGPLPAHRRTHGGVVWVHHRGGRLGVGVASGVVFRCRGIALSAIDIDTQRLPTKLVYVVLALVSVCLIGAAVKTGEWSRLGWAVAGASASAAILFALVVGSKGRGMGMGDVRLAFVLGAITGWFGPGRSAIGLFAGFAVGSVLGIAMALLVSASSRA